MVLSAYALQLLGFPPLGTPTLPISPLGRPSLIILVVCMYHRVTHRVPK